MNRELRPSAKRRLAAGIEVRSRVVPIDGEVLIELSIGSPPVPLKYVLDVGSDMMWTQCSPTSGSSAIYSHDTSSSFSPVPCSDNICQSKDAAFLSCNGGGSYCRYNRGYGDGSSSQGLMAKEKFTFGNGASFKNVYFGCGQLFNKDGSTKPPADQASGIVGLGRGPLSLVSQLNLETFWYCTTGRESASGSALGVGSPAGVTAAAAITTTPLLDTLSAWYLVLLKGITVGKTALFAGQESEFELNLDGSRGMVIDSGTSFTRLIPTVYTALRSELIAQLLVVGLQVAPAAAGLDLCFLLPGGGNTNVAFPQLTFHFDGGDLVIPTENYMQVVTVENSNLACLAMLSTEGTGLSTAIFGNSQQKNMNVTFDLVANNLSFKPTQCDQS
ncbi:unnamed protein product [Cuscuta europaea]|uniref:Peptidase A1 domain-containing protein n=1 Tax=Cuscuta europaea TaxID=41803 RepID=A0A9P1EC34_CUSEU|nr:unnamed protein product [Cuscuta europaea]